MINNITAAWAVDREFEYIKDPLETAARDARGTPGGRPGMPRGMPGDAPGPPGAGGGPGGGRVHFPVKSHDVPKVSEAIYL